jgi:hypothetical protein
MRPTQEYSGGTPRFLWFKFVKDVEIIRSNYQNTPSLATDSTSAAESEVVASRFTSLLPISLTTEE